MKKIYPSKLKKGDTISVIAPSRSLEIVAGKSKQIANNRLKKMGFKLHFGKHVKEVDDFNSTSIESRLTDLHNSFLNQNIDAIITVIGGYNSNQLLDYIDWKLIKRNPKIFCGYSDITVLANAIFAKTGLVTYSGPHYSSFGQKLYFDYTLNYFKKCLMSKSPFEIVQSKKWSDDSWYKDQDNRKLIENDGFLVINTGNAKGTIIGGNLCSFNLLQGTEYMPSLKDKVLFIEDDKLSDPMTFDRDLQSLIHQPGFDGVKAIVVGRFQKSSKMTDEYMKKIIKNKGKLEKIPIISKIDFGHTDPKITFPIGGTCKISATNGSCKIQILDH